MITKYQIFKSSSRSKRIIPKFQVKRVTGSVSIPKMEEIYSKNQQELSQLKIIEMM